MILHYIAGEHTFKHCKKRYNYRRRSLKMTKCWNFLNICRLTPIFNVRRVSRGRYYREKIFIFKTLGKKCSCYVCSNFYNFREENFHPLCTTKHNRQWKHHAFKWISLYEIIVDNSSLVVGTVELFTVHRKFLFLSPTIVSARLLFPNERTKIYSYGFVNELATGEEESSLPQRIPITGALNGPAVYISTADARVHTYATDMTL